MDAIVGGLFFYCAGLLATASLTASLAGGGHLVLVGPKPLRFERQTVRVDPAKALPPLLMSDAPSTNTTAAPNIPLVEPSATQSADDQQVAATPPEAVLEPDPAPQRQVTPDTLLQFFTPGRQRSTIISTPVEFSPPAVGQKSSTATYISQ